MADKRKPTHVDFDKASYRWKTGIDYRRHPELYRVGKGEQGVLICEPFKSELAPHWRFKTPDIATESSAVIDGMFANYLERNDLIGADMAGKFLQMGYTRARRYANYEGGKKYDKKDGAYEQKDRGTGDPKKAESARIFYERWKQAEADPRYAALKRDWKLNYG